MHINISFPMSDSKKTSTGLTDLEVLESAKKFGTNSIEHQKKKTFSEFHFRYRKRTHVSFIIDRHQHLFYNRRLW